MVTLSAGGNDAPFSLVLDACVYQWSRSCNKCDSVLAKAKDNVRGEKFAKDLDDLLEAIKDKLDSSSSRIYFVEYGKFFDTTTKQCDKVTWAFKIALGCRQFLTQDRRSAMNELVDEVNSQIKSAVERAGPQAVYVEWQSDMDLIGGRFCEPGVDETQGQDRDQTFFYEWGTHKDDPWKVPTNDLVPLTQSKRSFFQDNSAGLNLMTRSNNETANITGVSPETEGRLADSIVSTVRNGSSKWSNDNNHFGPVASALLNRTFDGTFEDQILAFMKEGAKGTPTENEFVFQDRNGTPVTIALPSGSSAIPAQYARVFHPTRAGHAIIAANVLSAMNDEAAKLLGKPSASTTILIQPTPTGPGSFQGVKVECYNDTKPVTFNFKDANQALWNFCFDHRSESLSGRPAIIGYFPGGSGENAALELKVTHDQSDDCQGVHQWDKINYYDCVGMMQQAMWDLLGECTCGQEC
ncbi:MAG: hypothetical protein M1820_001243 [Bogoriella megaspora]|nr:MAG: hypothetical protein M1820_001243 [Bogoriella megaspora]